MQTNHIQWADSRSAVPGSGTAMRGRGASMLAVETFSPALGAVAPAYLKAQANDARNGGTGAFHAWSPPI